jgi:uncharacterized membrane protein YfcA
VAGGGTLLTFPTLIWAGQPAIVANATNTMAVWPGALSSFWGYRAELGDSRKQLLLLLLPSFLGGVLGAVLLVNTAAATFAALVPYLILLATGLFMVQEPLSRVLSRSSRPAAGKPSDGEAASDTHVSLGADASPLRWAAVLGFQFLVGIYGGYFGAGIGILMLAAFGLLGFSNIHEANATKNLSSTFINVIAAILFAVKGLVQWRLAAIMAAGMIFGGYAGAGTARRIGQKNVRRMVIVIGLSLAGSLLICRSQ